MNGTLRPPDFDDLIGPDVPAEERARLRRAHDMLVAAGPPPDVPQSLEEPPAPGRVVPLSRRRSAWLGLAAALALAAAFAGGFLLGDREETFETRRDVVMRGTDNAPNASAVIELGAADSQGNWPMLVKVRGLKPLPAGGYYELLLTKDGRPLATCGSFKVKAAGDTTVRLGASYDVSKFDGWVIRPYIHDRPKFNKLVFLRTARI
jgi:Anti-sigma-K factor rskA